MKLKFKGSNRGNTSQRLRPAEKNLHKKTVVSKNYTYQVTYKPPCTA